MKGHIQPRVIRAGQASIYLGVSEPYFNEHVRPFVTEVRDGPKIVSFDRLDLDAWWEHHKAANGRPAQENLAWQKEPQVLERKVKSGTLKKSSPVSSFDKALEKRNSTKQSAI